MHAAQPDLTLIAIHTAVVEDRARVNNLEEAVREIARKLDRLQWWMLTGFAGIIVAILLKHPA